MKTESQVEKMLEQSRKSAETAVSESNNAKTAKDKAMWLDAASRHLHMMWAYEEVLEHDA